MFEKTRKTKLDVMMCQMVNIQQSIFEIILKNVLGTLPFIVVQTGMIKVFMSAW